MNGTNGANNASGNGGPPKRRHPLKILFRASGVMALLAMVASALATKLHDKRLLVVAVGLWVTAFLIANVPLAGYGAFSGWKRARRWFGKS